MVLSIHCEKRSFTFSMYQAKQWDAYRISSNKGLLRIEAGPVYRPGTRIEAGVMRVLPRPYFHAHERSTFASLSAPPLCPSERASYDLSFVSYDQLAIQ